MDEAVWQSRGADSSLYTIELRNSAPGNWKDMKAASVLWVRDTDCRATHIPPTV